MDKKIAKKVLIEASKNAGKVLMKNLGKVENATLKNRSDLVTKVDLESEKLIVSLIKKEFPSHHILTEESGFLKGKSKYTWVIDPIDGTINYYYGMSPFRIGIGLLEDGKPILTAIYNPIKSDLYFAEKGKGATLNGKRITVSSNYDLNNAVVMTHMSSKKEARMRTILFLETIFKKVMHMRVFGSGLSALSYIANGKFDVFFNVNTNPWDILPGSLLVEEAGGVVTDIYGGKISIESNSILATNGKVHNDMLKLLEGI